MLYLIDGGARRIAFLGGPNQMKQTIDRKHGYLEALRERDLPIMKELVKCDDISFNSGLSDTSIIGFMSDWVSNMTFPRMSFVKQNLKEMGCQTFLLLHDLLNGSESVKSIVINSQLNIRDSTRNNF